MEDKYAVYYKARKHHAEIFKKDNSVSFFELIYAVEAPKEFTSISIWDYTEVIDIKQILHDFTPIDQDQQDAYPYYELYVNIKWTGNWHPYILQETEQGLICIEGRHRLRLMALSGAVSVKAVVVSIVGARSETIYPPRYNEWLEYRSKHNFIQTAKEARKDFKGIAHAKFLY